MKKYFDTLFGTEHTGNAANVWKQQMAAVAISPWISCRGERRPTPKPKAEQAINS